MKTEDLKSCPFCGGKANRQMPSGIQEQAKRIKKERIKMKTETIDGFEVPGMIKRRMRENCDPDLCDLLGCEKCIFDYMHITPAREKAFLKWEAKQWVK